MKKHSMQPFSPVESLTIDDLETMRVLTEPVRMQILERLSQPNTVKAVATSLGLSTTKLYYHFNALEEKQLIRVVSTRLVSGILERRYQVAALRFEVSKDLFRVQSNPNEMGELLSNVLETVFQDAMRAFKAGKISFEQNLAEDLPSTMQRGTITMTPTRAKQFQKRLRKLQASFANDPLEADSQRYQWFELFHPAAEPAGPSVNKKTNPKKKTTKPNNS